MLDEERVEECPEAALGSLGADTAAPHAAHAEPTPDVAPAAPVSGRGTATARHFLRDPLVHFVLLGAALFLIWPFISARVAPPPNLIVISRGQMDRAVEIFVKTHARPPTQDELGGLAEQEIQTEVEYREGVALGLDRDDEIIRRRISQKLRFMIQDVVDEAVPTDAEMQRFLDAHRDEFGAEPQIAFSQVYLNPAQHGAGLAHDVASLLDRLNHSDGRLDYAADSDVLPVPNDFEATPLHTVASMFGDDFAASVGRQTPGVWAGPISSGYGVHLVLVRHRVEGAAPQLSQVRAAVLREWQSARRVEANAAADRDMRAKYRVRVDMPDAPAADVSN